MVEITTKPPTEMPDDFHPDVSGAITEALRVGLIERLSNGRLVIPDRPTVEKQSERKSLPVLRFK